MSLSHPYNVDDYKNIVNLIYEKHNKYSYDWSKSVQGTTFNLKKKQIRHITSNNPKNMDDFINKDFFKYMASYQEGLHELYADIVVDLEFDYSIPIIGRVKNDDSIVSKLHRKRLESNGSFSINKYLNDLLGFRIVDQNLKDNFTTFTEYINTLKNIRSTKRKVEGYRAFHIYFMGKSNKYFPLELQVWDVEDERSNLDSHKVYKKGYTYWPTKYKEG